MRTNRCVFSAACIPILLLLAACTKPVAPAVEENRVSLATLLSSDGQEGFLQALEPREFSFPEDHGPHPGFRNEWWYLTGNLDSESGRRFGFEFTIFRFALRPGALATETDWHTSQVYIGHFALSDVAADDFHVSERFSRGGAGLAGAQSSPYRVWLYDWNLRHRELDDRAGNWQLQVASEVASLDLLFESEKSPVLQGDAGLSRKSADAGNASYYYSLPRLKTSGVLTLADERFDVSGLSWMDREWSSSALAENQSGWDWFALQLDDGNDLMFYQLRRLDGSVDSFSAGALIRGDGRVRSLTHSDVEIDVLGYWESPLGGRYPQGWRLRVPSELIDVRVQPAMASQELDTWVRYWEGAVDVNGTRGAIRVGGRGYVELTGYADGPARIRP